MTLTPAPYFEDMARAPRGGRCHWLTTEDGKRIRIGHWPTEAEARGTILIFPGRTEYVEKYGMLAADLTARGYAVLAVDWRGQGRSTRFFQRGDAARDRRMVHTQPARGCGQRSLALQHREHLQVIPLHLIDLAQMECKRIQFCRFARALWWAAKPSQESSS